eukprot:2247-Heterococcus_DN1.PRE.2
MAGGILRAGIVNCEKPEEFQTMCLPSDGATLPYVLVFAADADEATRASAPTKFSIDKLSDAAAAAEASLDASLKDLITVVNMHDVSADQERSVVQSALFNFKQQDDYAFSKFMFLLVASKSDKPSILIKNIAAHHADIVKVRYNYEASIIAYISHIKLCKKRNIAVSQGRFLIVLLYTGVSILCTGILKVPGLSLMFAPAQDQYGNQIPLPGPNDLPQFVAVSYSATVTFQNLNMFVLQHAYHRQPHLFELIQEGGMQGVRKLTQEELQQRSSSATSSTTSADSSTNAAQSPTAAQIEATEITSENWENSICTRKQSALCVIVLIGGKNGTIMSDQELHAHQQEQLTTVKQAIAETGKGASVWQLVWIRADCQSEFATTLDSYTSDFTSHSNVVVYAPQRSRVTAMNDSHMTVNDIRSFLDGVLRSKYDSQKLLQIPSPIADRDCAEHIHTLYVTPEELDDDIGLDEDMMNEILQDEERRKEELAQMIEQEAKAAAEAEAQAKATAAKSKKKRKKKAKKATSNANKSSDL